MNELKKVKIVKSTLGVDRDGNPTAIPMSGKLYKVGEVYEFPPMIAARLIRMEIAVKVDENEKATVPAVAKPVAAKVKK